MVAQVDVSTDEGIAMLLDWQENDGSKSGLRNLRKQQNEKRREKQYTPVLIHKSKKRRKK